MALPNIQESLERSVYHAIRAVTVKEGYLPDITSYDIENTDNQIAKTEDKKYQQAMVDIVTAKGFCVEIFGTTPTQAKGALKPPRIIIDTQAFYPGSLGIDTTPSYRTNQGGGYSVFTGASQTSDFYFNVRLVSNTTEQNRVLHGIMVNALPRRGYMKWYTEPTLRLFENIFIRYISFSEFNYNDEGIIEKVYRYEIPDTHEIDEQLIRTVPKITEIGNHPTIINKI